MLTSLTYLHLRDCPNLSADRLAGISTRCAKLRTLHVAGCSAVTPVGIHHLIEEPVSNAARGAHLTHLDLSYTGLRNEAVMDISRACARLQH